jgi:hypothetical protein
MNLTYFWSSDLARKPFMTKCNESIETVPHLLEELRARGSDVKFVDTADMTEKQRFECYSRVTLPAVYKRYEVRKVLGTNRHSACWFGAEVPALFVTNTDSVGDTYPHRKGNRVTTIHNFLAGLPTVSAS